MAGVVKDFNESLTTLYFKPNGAAEDAPMLRVSRRSTTVHVAGVSKVSRTQFPLLPSFSQTAHRVQGATLEGDVHILLNKEFFAPGQAYVAMSRVRELGKLHCVLHRLSALTQLRSLCITVLSVHHSLSTSHSSVAVWGLDLDAIHADPRIEKEYHRLKSRRPTKDVVDAAPIREAAELPPLSNIDIQYNTSFNAPTCDL